MRSSGPGERRCTLGGCPMCLRCRPPHSPQCTSCSPGRSQSGTAHSWSSAVRAAGAAPASRGQRGHPAGSHRSCEGTLGTAKLPSAGLAIQPMRQPRPLLEPWCWVCLPPSCQLCCLSFPAASLLLGESLPIPDVHYKYPRQWDLLTPPHTAISLPRPLCLGLEDPKSGGSGCACTWAEPGAMSRPGGTRGSTHCR